jgi:hypothetical protein
LLLGFRRTLEDFFEPPPLCVPLRETLDSRELELWLDFLDELDAFDADLRDEWR